MLKIKKYLDFVSIYKQSNSLKKPFSANFCVKSKPNFFDKIKAKFNLKKEETKIDHSQLKEMNEEKNDTRTALLENEEDELPKDLKKYSISEEEKSKIVSEFNNNTEREILNLNISNLKQLEKEKLKEMKIENTLEFLNFHHKISTNEMQVTVKDDYNRVSYSEVILPRIQNLKKIGLNDTQIKVLVHKMHVFLLKDSNITKLAEYKDLLINLLKLSEVEACDVLACIPNIIELTSKKIESNIASIQEFYNFSPENLKSFLIEYPILISNFTKDISKIQFYFKLYLEMSKEDFHSLAVKSPLILTCAPDNTLDIFKTIDRMKINRQDFREIIEKNCKVFLFRHTQVTNVVTLLTKQGLRTKEVFNILKEYPDLLLANRYDLLRQKLQLFAELRINQSSIKNLVLNYPFILLKSYNSFINKVFYFKKELKMDIETIDIYPLIYVYNLERDIKPRCELMKKYNNWLPFSEAFAMTVDELALKLGANQTEVTKVDDFNYERDLLFRYSKYVTI